MIAEPSQTAGRTRSSPPDPRPAALTHGPEAEALIDEVHSSIATLTGLLVYDEELEPGAAASIRGAVEEVEERLRRRELRVALVGEPGSGKSTLLDALLGERLLGTATTEPSVVVRVRRSTERAYRARLKNGAIEDFATKVPDPTPRLAEDVATAEELCLEAKRRSEEATIELVAANDALEGAEGTLEEAVGALETARDDAARLGGELEGREQKLKELEGDADRALATVPAVLRARPAWWAVWLWAARVVAFLFASRAFRAYRRCANERDETERDVGARRLEVGRAEDRRSEAEARVSAANVPVEKAKKALAATRRIRDGADGRREELERDAERRRRGLESAKSEWHRRFAAEVRQLTNPAARGPEVAEIDIDFPATLLPVDVVIIDAAGTTAQDAELRGQAWKTIREQADGCIVVSALEHAVSSNVQRFLDQLKEAVPHAILFLTKMDESLAWAAKQGYGDPWEEVERARKIGTRRFAREVGRDPAAVFSVAVAAKEALRDGDGSAAVRRRFVADVETAFQVLRYERALILGARSAGIVRTCIAGAFEAEAHVEHYYQKRIAALEAQRIPDPDRFYAEQMRMAEAGIAAAARGVVVAAEKTLGDNAGLIRVECAQLVAASVTKDDLRALAPRLADAIRRGLVLTRRAVRGELDGQTGAALRKLEGSVFGALRERYQILHEVDRRPFSLHVDAPSENPLPNVDLAPAIEDAITGGIFSFARTQGRLKRAVVALCDGAVADLERDLVANVRATEPAAAASLRAGLGRSLEQAISRFGRWIAEPIAAERQVIERERDNLRDLETLRVTLYQHDARLARLLEAASGASVGLYA